MKCVITFILISILILVPRCEQVLAQETAAAAKPATAWNEGYPLKGLKNADNLVRSFKNKAGSLKNNEKLRILIIGDSLSDGHYHWSHHFRKNLQTAYGDGGYGAIWSIWEGSANAMRGWLWDPEKDFSVKANGRWLRGYGGRGDIWPYLGWNGDYLHTDQPDAGFDLTAVGSMFTVVYSKGSYITFNGDTIKNKSAGFTVKFDDKSQVVAPASDNDPIDMGLISFQAPNGKHKVQISDINNGILALHGFLVENDSPGVVVYNISHGGWWAHNYIWRQPGFEKLIAAFKPDMTIIFLSKPESRGSTEASDTRINPEYEMLVKRVKNAAPSSELLFFKCWDPRAGISPPDARTQQERTDWFEANKYPYLDLQYGLDRLAMNELEWYHDNIHLSPAGGKGIGDAISALFLP